MDTWRQVKHVPHFLFREKLKEYIRAVNLQPEQVKFVKLLKGKARHGERIQYFPKKRTLQVMCKSDYSALLEHPRVNSAA